MSPVVQHLYFFLETCYSIATEKSFLLDLITRVFLRSLQYGIVVMGFLDAFVYAHHQHRQGFENPGIFFGDCMKGRIRFMTAITPAYAHAYQAHPELPLTSSRPDIRTFPMLVPQYVKEAMISEDGLFIQMEVLASLMVKLWLDGV